MKRIILFLVLISLVSCLKKPEYTPKTALVTYSFNAAKDMGALFDFSVSYVDQDKNVVKEQITSLPWSKKITPILPFDSHLEVNFTAKNNFPDQATYEVGFKGLIEHSEMSKPTVEAMMTKMVVDDGKLRFSIALPAGVSPDEVRLSVAPLKYDKHFAFTFTVDDATENAWSRIFPLVHRKWIDDKEFFHLGNPPTAGYIPEHTLSMSDGCGHERRFGYGVAITPTYRNSYTKYEPRMQETSQNSLYITWEELRIMLDFGCAVHYHNVDETKYEKTDPVQITQGFEDDYNKVIEKLGYKMKVLALPDGLQSYLDAGRSFPQIEFIRNALSNDLIRLKSCGGLRNKETYGGEHHAVIDKKLAELASQASSADPYWVGLTVHRPQTDYMEMLTQIYNLYGKAGADNLWVASWDEIYEYQEFRYASTIDKRVEGQTVTFEVSLPERPDFTFRDLSFIVEGVGSDCPVTPLSGNIYGLSHAVRNGKMLVNVNFNSALLERAEKYTAQYESSASETDKDDALYFASMLLPDLAAPFILRIENRKDHPAIRSMTINDGANTVYEGLVRIALETSGNPTVYRIGETSDLSAVEWQTYSPEISHTLSPGFGKKTIYLQVGNGTWESEISSAGFVYADVPESGKISRDAVKAYQTKYNGHKVTVDKQIKKSK